MVRFMGRFFTKKWLLVLGIFLLVIAITFSMTRTGRAVSKAGTPLRQYTVTRKDLENVVSLSGIVAAQEKVILQFQSSGKLAWVGVQEGDVVTKGQIIASLDQRSLRKDLEKDLKDFSNQRLTLDQFRDTNKSQNTGRDNTYLTDQLTRLAQENQNGLDKSIIDVELDNLSLELANLSSPIDGIVTQIDQSVAGVNITPATARFVIVNPESLYLLGSVDQQDIAKIRLRSRVKIVFDAYPNSIYLGAVLYIAFAPDSGDNNAYSIKISIPLNAIRLLRLAMGAEISIVTETRKKALVIPIEAIIEEGGDKFVNVLTKPTQTKRHVKTGLETDDFIQIIQGLQTNDIVVY